MDAPAQPLHVVSAATSLTTPAGAEVTVVDDAVSIRDQEGRLLLRYDAEAGTVVIDGGAHLQLSGRRVSIETDELNVRAGRIVERSRDVFRTVEGILETRAHRARTVVSRLLEFSARRTSVVSEEETHIDGKRVLLG